MDAGTYPLKEYEAKLLDAAAEIVQWGFGKVTMEVRETKNFKTKVTIESGKSWCFLVDKDMPEFKKVL